MNCRIPQCLRRTLLSFVCVTVLTGAATNAHAVFTNGGFETGDFTGWTKTFFLNNGLDNGPNGPFTGADIIMDAGGADQSDIVGPFAPETGIDPELGGAATLKYPKYGSYAARVNGVGANHKSGRMVQSMVITGADVGADGLVHIRFVYAPVLEVSPHSPHERPYFYFGVSDLTQPGPVLYERLVFENQSGVSWKTSPLSSSVKYVDWQIVDIPLSTTRIGHTLELVVIAAGCGQTQHFGYVYVDGFGSQIPGLAVEKTASPSPVTAGQNLTYTFTYTNGGATSVDDVVITETIPKCATWVADTDPTTGGNCSYASGVVTCTLGTLAAGATGTFTVTVTVADSLKCPEINNGNYTIGGHDNPPLTGPLITTPIAYNCTRTGLVLEYGFDDTSQLGKDSSGTGNVGESAAAVPIVGRCGKALRFRGNNNVQEFSAPSTSTLNLTGALTGIAWIRPRGKQSTDFNPSCTEGTIFSKGGNYWFQLERDNNQLLLQNDGGAVANVTLSPALTVNEWTSVAFTRSADGHSIQFYRDCHAVGSAVVLSSTPSTNANPVMVGNYGYGNDPSACEFNGDIDEIKLFDRALSSSEMAMMCACPCADTTPDPCDPVDALTINTGWDQSTSSLIAVGAPDNEWIATADPDPNTNEPRPAYVIPPYAPNNQAWANPEPDSRWISSYPTSANDLNGHYVFEYPFCLQDDAGASMSVCLHADDRASVYVNGSLAGSTGPSSFFFNAPCVPITATSGFVTGANVITVDVANTNSHAMGLDLIGSISGSVPQYEYCCSTSGQLKGQIWKDLNGNHVRDGSEPPIPNMTVQLSNNQTTATDSLGNYYFTGLAPGAYTVTRSTPWDYTATFPPHDPAAPLGVRRHVVLLDAGEVVPDLDFGLKPRTIVVGDPDTDISKCNAAKKKCLGKYVAATMACHIKAASKGLAVDQACLAKAVAKVTGGGKGCFDKKEAKVPNDCTEIGDAAFRLAESDAFVTDVVSRLDPGYPVPTLSRCSAARMKCLGKAAAGLLACDAKVNKDGIGDPACAPKAVSRYDDCDAKALIKGVDCLGFESTASLELTMYDWASIAAGQLAPPSCGNGIDEPEESCDPSTPASGWAGCGPEFTCTNACTCACPTSMDVVMDETDTDTSIDIGWSGLWHRNSIASGGGLRVQLACNAASRPCGTCAVAGLLVNGEAGTIDNRRCSNDTSIVCSDDSPCLGGGGSCQFYWGAPLPLASSGVAACVFNEFVGAVSGSTSLETGSMTIEGALAANVYTAVSTDSPCVRCVNDGVPNDGVRGGTCSGAGSPRNGLPCDANGSVPDHPDFGSTSLDCPSSPSGLLGALPIELTLATDPVTKTLTASSPACSGTSPEKCLCDTCNSAAQQPCDSNTDCPDPAGPIGPICGGRRCLGGPNDGAACIAGSECPSGSCARAGALTKPSSCVDDTSTDERLDCTDTAPIDGEGECTLGPQTHQCSVASGHAQRACSSDAECGGGSGSCLAENQRCFLTGGFAPGTGLGTNTLTSLGRTDPAVQDIASPTFGSVFCAAPTTSSSLNTVAGLPGPGRLSIKAIMIAHP